MHISPSFWVHLIWLSKNGYIHVKTTYSKGKVIPGVIDIILMAKVQIRETSIGFLDAAQLVCLTLSKQQKYEILMLLLKGVY